MGIKKSHSTSPVSFYSLKKLSKRRSNLRPGGSFINKKAGVEFIEITLKYGKFKEYFNITTTCLKVLRDMAKQFLFNNNVIILASTPIILMKHDYYTPNILTILSNSEEVEHGSIIEVIVCETYKTYTNGMVHNFEYIINKKIFTCDFCHEEIAPIRYTGIFCLGCKLNFHKECAKKIDELCLCHVVSHIKESESVNLTEIQQFDKKNVQDNFKTQSLEENFSANSMGKQIQTISKTVLRKKKMVLKSNSNKFEEIEVYKGHNFLVQRAPNNEICYVCFYKINRSKDLLYSCSCCFIKCHSFCYKKVVKSCVFTIINDESQKLSKLRLDSGCIKSPNQNIPTISNDYPPLYRTDAIKKYEKCQFRRIIYRSNFTFFSENSPKKIYSLWCLDEENLIIYDTFKNNTVYLTLPLSYIVSVECDPDYILSFNLKYDISFILVTKEEKIFCGDVKISPDIVNKVKKRKNSQISSLLLNLNKKCDRWFYYFNDIANKNNKLLKLINDFDESVLDDEIVDENVISIFYDIKMDSQIGSGQFGIVVNAIEKKNKKIFAVKIINKTKFKPKDLLIFQYEYKIVSDLDHFGIIKMYKYMETSKNIYMVMEKLERDLLETILSSENGKLTEKLTKFITYQIVLAIKYLHERMIGHFDIKPENVLISKIKSQTDNPLVKLCDFGFSKVINDDQKLSNVVGTPKYLPPEVVFQHSYNKLLDIWSLGILTYVSLSGKFPFNDGKDMITQVFNEAYMFPVPQWNLITKLGKGFVLYCLNPDPDLRPGITNVKRHSWFMDESMKLEIKQFENEYK